MLKPSSAKNARRRNQARKSQGRASDPSGTESPHVKAIRRLRIELQAEEGLFGCFHGGVDWRCAQYLLPRGSKVVVETERPMTVAGKRYVPDLRVSCARTHRTLLLIEVWHTHVVSPSKRRAYNAFGMPWVEVRTWHVLERHRKRPLPILDWGGDEMPDPPRQWEMFDTEGSAHDQRDRIPRGVRGKARRLCQPPAEQSTGLGLFDSHPTASPQAARLRTGDDERNRLSSS